MKPEEYEKTIKGIVNILYEHNRGIAPDKIKYGKVNKIEGISGYSHQIDISLHGSSELILIECKKWKRRVRVSEFLCFLSRIKDIAHKFSKCRVNGMIVTTMGFQKGVYKLAKYYKKIELATAISLKDFSLKYGENLRIVSITPPPATASVGANNPVVAISQNIEAILLDETSEKIYVQYHGYKVWLPKYSCLFTKIEKNKILISIPIDLYESNFKKISANKIINANFNRK